MKKITVIITILSLLLSMTACSGNLSTGDADEIDTISKADEPVEQDSENLENQEEQDSEDLEDQEEQDSEDHDEAVFEHGFDPDTLIYNYNNFIKNNLYISFQKSSDEGDYDNLIKLPTSESITYYKDGYTSIKDKNNRVVHFGDEISIFNDFDYLDLMTNAVNLMFTEVVTTRIVDLTYAYDETVYEFVLDIRGYDNCEKFYSQLNPEYGKLMRKNLEESANNSGYDSEESPINLRFAYVIDKTGITSGGFYTYFSKDELGVDKASWDECYTMWYFDDFWKIGDWEFPESWYNFDFEKAIQNNDIDSIVSIGQSICDNANKAAEDYYSTVSS